MEKQFTVHDPRGYPPKVSAQRLAPRLETLEGKLVYLVDCLFDNSDVFMDQMQKWFAEHLPAVRTRIVRPSGPMREFTPSKSWADDPDMLARIQADGDGDSALFPENEERSPWEPFHVQHGFKPSDSTVSTFLGGWYTQAGFGARDTWEQKFRHCLQASEPYLAPLLILDPIVARELVERGFNSKTKLIEWCAENARLTAREYWDNPWAQTLIRPLALAGVEPHATHLKAKPDELLRMFRQQDINVVVAGGETVGAWKMIGGSYRGNTISVDAWR